ncbi:MAG: TIR domain-containing protein [Neisseriales bacterium]|nr:MAG: TIR domain-containing protein [Neisseriales bacterium]
MKVFISWSGEKSHKVASLLNIWLKCVIQVINPWLSSKDIDKGSLWFNEITEQLSDTGIGIICLTKENKSKPWILFESGALAKGITSNRVCTLLIDLEPGEVENPLAQFNHTKIDKEGMLGLVKTINKAVKDSSLTEGILETIFETYWSQFDKKIQEILATPQSEIEEIDEERTENDLLLEIISSIRNIEKRMNRLEHVNQNEKRFNVPEIRTFLNSIDKFRYTPDEVANMLSEEFPASKKYFLAVFEKEINDITIPF